MADLSELKGKKVAVLGLNAAGIEMVKALAQAGIQVIGLSFREGKKTKEIKAALAGVSCLLYFRMPPEHALLAFDFVIDTPGGGTFAKLIERAKRGGVPVLSDLDFVSLFLKGKIVGVTGTNGKSSTVAFLDTMLRRQGFKTLVLGGDFAPFAAALITKKKYDFCLIEVSSRRLEISANFHPHIAILTNIFLAHADRHERGVEGYYDAKAKLYALQTEQDFLIHEGTAPNLKELMKLKKPRATRIGFALQGKTPPPCILFDKGNLLYSSPDGEMEIYPLEKLAVRTAPHLLNLMAALPAARLCGVEPNTILSVIESYLGMPHRMEWVKTVGKVFFIDDSRATNPGAAIWALGSFPKPVVWIAGGQVRPDGNLESLSAQAKGRARCIVLFGRQRKKLKKILEGMAPILEVETIAEAVALAFRQTLPNDTVLFSPACPPDPMDPNNSGAGRQFQKKVKALHPLDRTLPVVTR